MLSTRLNCGTPRREGDYECMWKALGDFLGKICWDVSFENVHITEVILNPSNGLLPFTAYQPEVANI